MFIRPSLSILAMLGALLGASVAARAQAYPLPTAPPAAGSQAPAGFGAPGAQRPHRLRAVLGQLNLTPNQRGQIRSIMQSFRAARRSGQPVTRKQLLAQIEGVLNPDQRTRFEAGMHRHRRFTQSAPQNS